MNIIDCFNDAGTLILSRFFTFKFGKIPCHLMLTFNEEEDYCDLDKVSDSLLNEYIPNIKHIRRCTNKYTSVGGAIEKEEQSNSSIAAKALRMSDSGSMIQIFTSDKMYCLDYNSISIRYIDENEADIEQEARNIYSNLPKKVAESKEAVANLVGYSDGQYYTIESKVKKVDININENYNDDFIPVYNDILSFIDSRESGLVLLYGIPGSGKSSLLRHLCSKHPKDYIIVPTSLTNRLGDPDFVSFMIDNANSVFILEDCEQILMDRGVNMFNGAISNILNMSDGLLSDIMNIKFICTFNADIKTIDNALLRKGRCYAKYEFKELEESKVRALNDKYNLGLTEIRPMTLAEIYNADKTEYSEDRKMNKIGF